MYLQVIGFLSFLWLINILFVYIYHVSLSVNRYLGYFHVLAIVNNATINAEVEIPL